MSHVATVDVHITNLDALKRACENLGLEFREGQKTYKWYGRHVGDYPIPDGYNKNDLGRCTHAIAIPGNSNAYEIGVVERRDGKEGFTLMWDFWNGGNGLQKIVGNDCNNLNQQYGKEQTIDFANENGYSYSEETLDDGSVEITLDQY
jgi:hypothetical protein